MRKPAIPTTSSLPVDLARLLEPMKQNIELITGARPGMDPVQPLATTATTAQIIAKINEILSRLNQSG
jgi:hypothetical protein